MKQIWKGDYCEIVDLGGVDGLRLFCEGVSKKREEHLLEHLGVEYIIQSRANSHFDEALILDFNPEDLNKVLGYFGIKNIK